MITRLGTQAQIKGSSYAKPCALATTGPITLSGTQSIDGVTANVGDRVLVKNQAAGADNGIYVVSSSTWSRAIDMSLDDDVFTGLQVYINSGTVNGSKIFVLTTTGTITLGSTSLTFIVEATGGGLVVSASNASSNVSTLVFSNANGISFGLSNNTITGSITNNTFTALIYQNRQLGASTNTVPGQNSVWLAPFYIGNNVSASTGLHMVSITGSVTSNQTNTVNLTFLGALYKVTGTNQSLYNTVFSTTLGFTFWNSGTASVSFSYNGGSASSAGSNLMTASIFGIRQLTFNIGSVLDTGNYAWGFAQSTASAGGSSIMRSFNAVVDNPMPLGQGLFIAATNASIGYVEGGTYSVTSASMPVSFLYNEIRLTNNAVPYFKMGAI